ncbi:MAG: urease accessory protein UreD [Sarcina sp.]
MINEIESKIAGNSKLVLEEKENGTVASTCYFVGASKISPAIFLGREKTPCYFLLHLGGGYVEGEIYKSLIEVKKSAKVIITTQAPTKVYKCEKNKEPSQQQTIINMEKGSRLEYISDAVILYKNAKYNQDTIINIEAGATLIYTDGITSGWSPDGAKFQYESVRMRNKVYFQGKLLLLDNLELIPKDYDVTKLGILEGYINFGTLLVIDERIDESYVEKARELIKNLNLNLKYGVSLLEKNGLILRVLGNLTQEIQKAIDEVHYYLRDNLFELKPINIRKY